MASIRAQISWQAVAEALEHAASSADELSIVDLGGGTGAAAVRLAGMGHRVAVVDSSPDALASLGRRIADADVEVTALLSDAEMLTEVVDAGSADLVLCHGLLEHVADPLAVLRSVRAALRPGGIVSVVVPGRASAIAARAQAGDLVTARAFAEADISRWDRSELGPRRYLWEEVADLVESAGFALAGQYGVRVLPDDVPTEDAEGEPVAAQLILELEAQLRADSRFAVTSGGLQAIGRLE